MSSMTPKNREELQERYNANLKFTGSGLQTVTHYPCPFCGAPDWASTKILGVREELTKEHTCSECGRSGRFDFSEELWGQLITLVPTGGKEPDPWVAVRGH